MMKQNATPPRMLNANPLAQFISMDTIAEALIDDVPTKVLLDTGATINLMPVSYAKAAGLEIKPLSLIIDKHVTMSLLQVSTQKLLDTQSVSESEGTWNPDYNMDRLALLAEDDLSYSRHYHWFIKNFAKITKPLHDYMRGDLH